MKTYREVSTSERLPDNHVKTIFIMNSGLVTQTDITEQDHNYVKKAFKSWLEELPSPQPDLRNELIKLLRSLEKDGGNKFTNVDFIVDRYLSLPQEQPEATGVHWKPNYVKEQPEPQSGEVMPDIEKCVQSFIRSEHLTRKWDRFRDEWFENKAKSVEAEKEEGYESAT